MRMQVSVYKRVKRCCVVLFFFFSPRVGPRQLTLSPSTRWLWSSTFTSAGGVCTRPPGQVGGPHTQHTHTNSGHRCSCTHSRRCRFLYCEHSRVQCLTESVTLYKCVMSMTQHFFFCCSRVIDECKYSVLMLFYSLFKVFL